MIRSIVFLALLFLSACVVAEDEARTITVTGSGSSEIDPDYAMVRMSIVARHATLAAAQEQAAKVTTKVLSLTDKLGIKRERVDTTGSSVRPDYRWNRETEEQELRGYIAERQMNVDLRDLEKLGALIEGAVSAGVNQVSPPVLGSSKHREAHRDALANAAKDAAANAERLAISLGASLGAVLQIHAGANGSRPPVPQMARVQSMATDSAAEASYNAADLKYDAVITVVFALEN